MWYRLAADMFDISLSGSPSSLGQNTGIPVNPADVAKIKDAVESHQAIEFTTQSGRKMVQIHGTSNDKNEFCGEVEPGKVLCGQELVDHFKQKGYASNQIIACGAGNLPASSGLKPAFTEKGIVEIGFPEIKPGSTDPVWLPITKA